jgi:hypothetical protein
MLTLLDVRRVHASPGDGKPALSAGVKPFEGECLMNALMALVGGAIAVAGGDKLAGQRGYERMFHHLGWSESGMRNAALAETIGGTLMVPAATRRFGGALVAGVSMAVIATEIQNREPKLALPRALVLVAGLWALLAPGHRR